MLAREVSCSGQVLCGADEGEFVNLQQKHNFSLAHFGMLLGVLRTALEHLQVCQEHVC